MEGQGHGDRIAFLDILEGLRREVQLEFTRVRVEADRTGLVVDSGHGAGHSMLTFHAPLAPALGRGKSTSPGETHHEDDAGQPRKCLLHPLDPLSARVTD